MIHDNFFFGCVFCVFYFWRGTMILIRSAVVVLSVLVVTVNLVIGGS